MRTFYVFRRGTRKNFYVQFVDPITGKLNSARSTGKENYSDAMQQAYIMLQTVPAVKKKENIIDSFQQAIQTHTLTNSDIMRLREMLNMNTTELSYSYESSAIQNTIQKTKTPLLAWLSEFWNYEKSEYVQDKLSHGKKVSKRYCHDQTLILRHWAEYFDTDFALEDLTIKHLKDFEKFLWSKEIQKKRIVQDEKTGKKHVEEFTVKFSTTTRNNIIKCASIAYEWAVRQKIVPENPCKGLTAYKVTAQKRDILTRKEVSKLFTQGTWRDERARVANLVAMTTGMRISEIQALQESDIGDDRIYVRSSWSPVDGLTTTKNGESREVPLVPKVRTELLKLCMQNPHQEVRDKFIFFGNLPNKPIVPNVITDDFKQALESIGISENQRQKRSIVFHSWRHFYATTIATELSEKHAQLTLGHLTQAMTKHYADHKTEEALLSVCTASNDIFMSMLA